MRQDIISVFISDVQSRCKLKFQAGKRSKTFSKNKNEGELNDYLL